MSCHRSTYHHGRKLTIPCLIRYIINDLNINSAVTVPDHDQVLDLSTHPENEPFRIQGYAYTGGGKRIHRVEVSLDEGETWEISEIDCPEDKYRIAPIHDHPFFGTLDLSETEMSFAWCFWELKVDVARLRDAPAIFVRATDEGLAQQPRDMYWNAMSMMNNWWFRVAIHKTGESLSFEHPTVAGNTNGGWMQRMNEEGVSVRTPQFSAVAASSEEGAPAPKPKAKEDIMAAMTDAAKMSTMITRAQLAEHANEERPWFVINGHVYDGTEFLEKHPGGGDSITLVAGEDASEDFMAIHSMDAKKQLADFHLGKLEEGGEAAPAGQDDNWASQAFLHPKQWKSAKLVKRTDISHDSRILRFALDREDQEVGLPIGQHVFVRLRATNKSGETETVQRAYTPFSGNELRGYIDLLIKVYFPSSSVPTGGRMTMLIEDMKPGIDSIEFKGPLGGFTYLPGGSCRWKGSVRKLRNIAMIAGGSGITPIYSTLKGIAEDSDSGETNVWVLDANRTENDILARAQLDGLVERAAGRIKIWHVLSADDVAPSWAMGRGRVSLDLLRERLPPPPSKPTEEGQLEDTLALLCGPPAMEETVKKGLAQIGWDTDRTVVCF